ncbi:MAG TPA: isochorismatase family protein [Candidatus Hydrogenedentes bacterium]|nr:isochorismatase family protein [Candidatus Hydrogenedentota bacterium]HOS02132.1 isochorismatase family protein [Candidatus Hydrogenedentota bacterium]
MRLDTDFFEQCAFVSVDFQEGGRGGRMCDAELPALWKEMGFTAGDVNAASDFGWDVARPNAIRVVEACRSIGLSMVFIHWGHLYPDGMDLDPIIRRTMLEAHGTDYAKWGGRIGENGSRPPEAFAVRPGEYVMAKTAQDAFISSNIEFLLHNLGVRNLVFIGGHTEACLGKTSTSAKRKGFITLCVEDATFNARESTRLKGIHESQYDFVVKTDEFLALVEKRNAEYAALKGN